jgi:NAD(P)H-quinone oxidoreductase subunit 5
MNQNLLGLIAFLSPLAFLITAIFSWFNPGVKPVSVKKAILISTKISLLVAALSIFLVYKFKLIETSTIGIDGFGMSLRLDAISILMLAMTALLSFIIAKFSINYLDGDSRQGAFLGRLSAALASVQLLILSGNLGLLVISWILTSVSLHRLLVFYKERPGAKNAARKKFIVARLGDICLISASVLLYNQFGTGNLEEIFKQFKNSSGLGQIYPSVEIASLFIAMAAMLKSAQFPSHGWLIEVMETPTPVSALLHAGLLNAGPFLIIRMAFIVNSSNYALISLISIGAFTALFGSVVYLTQTSVKTALGYSSIAHMGFSLMVSGMGLYPAAMLHLVAHSFYKAHAFLSSGSVIEVLRSSKVKTKVKTKNPITLIIGILMGLGVYSVFALAWGIDPQEEFSLLALGLIIVMGLSTIFASAIDSGLNFKLIIRACLLSLIVTASFFILESGSRHLLSNQLPEIAKPSLNAIYLFLAVIVVFGIIVFIQLISPFLNKKESYNSLMTHLRNGLYINAILDRIVRSQYTLEFNSRKSISEEWVYNNTLSSVELEKIVN